ncbi:hypothetical protein HMPREF1870_02598 [Bacteroidales bacterium KA00344]|nr:hypothetical protein HMPREF1870_02598 [Bacteroidales bacterium KA00344]
MFDDFPEFNLDFDISAVGSFLIFSFKLFYSSKWKVIDKKICYLPL